MEYPKIETLFTRDEKFKVTDQLRHPVYGDFKMWHMTEKVDGTNIRITLTPEGEMKLGGRSEEAQLHAGLYEALLKMFSAEKLKEVFWKELQEGEIRRPVVLYGEGYGAGIQKGGGNLSAQKTFRLFDVLVTGLGLDGNPYGWWLEWKDVQDVAVKLGIKTVPDMGTTTLDDAIELVKKGFFSKVAEEETGTDNHPSEGVVLRPRQTVFDRAGRRIIIKIKTKDFTDNK